MPSVFPYGMESKSSVLCDLSKDYTHGFKIVQLTSLRPNADLFCTLLREALKAELQKGQMKAVKGFVKTCYSETLVSGSVNPETEREDSSRDDIQGDDDETAYHGGLGLRFKFPGDPKKSAMSRRLKLLSNHPF
jgi:hypothetical protein